MILGGDIRDEVNDIDEAGTMRLRSGSEETIKSIRS